MGTGMHQDVLLKYVFYDEFYHIHRVNTSL